MGKKYFNGELLKTPESLEILKNRLILRPLHSTKIIAITAYSDDPREAAAVANAVIEAYLDYAGEKKYPAGAVEIIDHAEPTRVPIRPNKPLNITLGAMFGVFLGGLAALLVWGFASRRSQRR